PFVVPAFGTTTVRTMEARSFSLVNGAGPKMSLEPLVLVPPSLVTLRLLRPTRGRACAFGVAQSCSGFGHAPGYGVLLSAVCSAPRGFGLLLGRSFLKGLQVRELSGVPSLELPLRHVAGVGRPRFETGPVVGLPEPGRLALFDSG